MSVRSGDDADAAALCACEIASSLLRGKFFTPPVALPHLPIALLAAGLAVFG